MDIAPLYSTDSNSVYYDAFEYSTGRCDSETTASPTNNNMHSSKEASAPITTTPVKPVIGDQAVENEIQARRKSSKSGDDRRGRSMKKYELVDPGPVDAGLTVTGGAVDVEQGEEEEHGDYRKGKVIQRQNLNESAGWLPAVDEALPRLASGKRSKSVGQTRSASESKHDETHIRSASSSLGRRGDRLYDDGDDRGSRQRNWGEPSTASTANRATSVRSAGTTGTTLTSAFLPNGAGTMRVRADDSRQQKNKGKGSFRWGLGTGKKDKIEQEIDKVVLAERKTEKRALTDVVKELNELTKVQKGAVKVRVFFSFSLYTLNFRSIFRTNPRRKKSSPLFSKLCTNPSWRI